MVNPEPGRSSSSPNVKITELKREGTDGNVLHVHLDDGSLFLLDADGPPASLLEPGLSLDPDLYSQLEYASELFHCRRKALSLLARAEQCRQGLAAKLFKKGFSRKAVSASLDKLEAAGLLDDRRFAEAWVRSRLRGRPEGPSRLRAALMAKGISSATAGEAVASVFEEMGDEDAEETLRRALEKLSGKPGISKEKLIAGLVRRGFQLSKIRAILKDKNMNS